MPEIEELANTCTAAIRSAFEKYTSARNPAWFVGEFIDAKGVSSSQNGVYGVSAWLALSGLFRCENDRLGASCTKFLLDAVGRAHKDQETEKEAPPHELRYVLPKMCAAYWGLCSEPATKNGAEQVASAREQVLNWILDSRDPTAGGWPFVYQDEISNPEPVATALVVRIKTVFSGHSLASSSPSAIIQKRQSIIFVHLLSLADSHLSVEPKEPLASLSHAPGDRLEHSCQVCSFGQ